MPGLTSPHFASIPASRLPGGKLPWLARASGNREGEGVALGSLGLAYSSLGEVRRAIEFYDQQLKIVREIGDRRGEGNALGNLGNAYSSLGEVRRAIEFYEQHLKITREIGDRQGEGQPWAALGWPTPTWARCGGRSSFTSSI